MTDPKQAKKEYSRILSASFMQSFEKALSTSKMMSPCHQKQEKTNFGEASAMQILDALKEPTEQPSREP